MPTSYQQYQCHNQYKNHTYHNRVTQNIGCFIGLCVHLLFLHHHSLISTFNHLLTDSSDILAVRYSTCSIGFRRNKSRSLALSHTNPNTTVYTWLSAECVAAQYQPTAVPMLSTFLSGSFHHHRSNLFECCRILFSK